MKAQNLIYNKIGTGYNQTRRADQYIAERLFKLLSPQKEKSYLDLGCGTGNYTLNLAMRGYAFTGIDPSDKMLRYAREKSTLVDWVLGSAEKIPAPDNCFHGAIATLTIHHWPNLKKCFGELHRVLKNHSRFVLFTSTPHQMKGYWLNHYFPDMMKKSMSVMPSFEKINEALEATGFQVRKTECYFTRTDLQDSFLYVGKNNPGIYFDKAVRNGITSFTLHSLAEEVENGLGKLKRDIDSGDFERLKAGYENDIGDYLFVVAERGKTDLKPAKRHAGTGK